MILLAQRSSPPPLPFFARCLRHVVSLEEAIPGEDPDAPGPPRGFVFPEAPAIVDALARSMAAHGDLFDAGRAASLHTGLARAAGWLALQVALQRLAERAGAHYLREQSAVTREALTLLRGVREIARQPGASRTDRLRLCALALPEALVRRWQRRTTGKRR